MKITKSQLIQIIKEELDEYDRIYGDDEPVDSTVDLTDVPEQIDRVIELIRAGNVNAGVNRLLAIKTQFDAIINPGA